MPAAPARQAAQVVVGGTLIHTIRTAWAGHSPRQRADEVQERLTVAMAQGPIYPKDITVAKMQVIGVCWYTGGACSRRTDLQQSSRRPIRRHSPSNGPCACAKCSRI